MAYIGSTPTSQNFISGTDYFSGTGSQTAFTLTRTVNSVNDIEVVINNVVQQPSTAYTLSGTTITFTSAPSLGTNNIYVRYLSTTMQSITVPANSITRNNLDSSLQSSLLSTTNPQSGGVIQVVNASYSTQTDSTSQSYADTGLTATITPKFSTSKILILVNHPENLKSNTNGNNDLGLNICRNGSQLVEFNNQLGMQFSAGYLVFSASYTYLDNPATTSATTYKTQFKNTDSATDKVRVQSSSKPSTITLMEIAQ